MILIMLAVAAPILLAVLVAAGAWLLAGRAAPQPAVGPFPHRNPLARPQEAV